MSKWSSRTSDQFIWLVSEKKTEAVKAYFIKNSKGVGVGGGGEIEEGKKERGGGGWSEGSRKDWAELYGCQMTSHCNGNHSKTSVSLSVSERDRELELEL